MYNIIMKIVILDTAAVKQRNMNFDFLKKYGEVISYDITEYNEIINRIIDADIVVTNKVPIDKNIIDNCKNLKFISVLATGYNIIDTEYARKKGIIVSNVPKYSTESVVQLTFAFILEIACKINLHNSLVKSGEWAKHNIFCLCRDQMFELSGKTIGIIGYGAIGKRVAEVAKTFGMNVLVNTRTKRENCVELEYLFNNSDIITLHCPLTKENKEMIDYNSIMKMKDDVIIINTARGGLVNEKDVSDALNSGKIAYFAADVLSTEPPKSDNPILKAKNTIITSHIAWMTDEALERLMRITDENVKSYLSGKPINVV